MSQLTAMALLVLQDQLGAITSSQLRASGVTDRRRRRLLEDGVLTPTGHCVYQVTGTPVSLTTRLISLCLQHPQGFVTGPTAGGILGLRRMPKASKLHFCVPHGGRFDCPNFVQLRQSSTMSKDHVRQLDNGIRVATFERLAFDLARDLTQANLSSVVEQMLQRNATTVEDLGAMARLLCHPRRPGSVRFARVLLRRHPGAAAESHPELLVLNGLVTAGVPVQAQTRLSLPNSTAIRIDMSVPEVRWAVEVDVHPDHLGLEGGTRDRQRDRQLHLVDWQVERVTALDLLDLGTTVRELAELYQRRKDTMTAQSRISAPPVVTETLA